MIRSMAILQNAGAVTVAELFEDHIYRNHGIPQKSIKIAPPTACNPQTDGQTEIANKNVEEMSRAFANVRKENWEST